MGGPTASYSKELGGLSIYHQAPHGFSVKDVLYFNATEDCFEVFFYQNSGSSENIGGHPS
ncbi:MAG TPA: hypothetical protein ENI77_04735 [Nitrospirae bacterium]|nr:hypothetical protein [Nitrospirota bacterium]